MDEAKQAIISKEVLIPIGLVCTMMGASLTFGIMYNKVDELGSVVDKQTEIIAELSRESSSLREESARQGATISQVLTTLSDIKSDVNAIRDAQVKRYGGT